MLTDEMLRSGRAAPAPVPTMLTAGPLTCRFLAGELRDVRWQGVEIVRRLYVAVRDRDWGTVPIALEDVRIVQDADAFRVAFVTIHRTETPDPIVFRWHGGFFGTPLGLVCTMDGTAETTFQRNRIGWCVLHPPETCAGEPCTITHPDGTTTAAFPALIAPHQPFLGIRQMAHTTRGGPRVTLDFDGDIFETEDQRNWTDDSYKTYSTPLTLPFPVRVTPGTTVQQSVTLTVEGEATGDTAPQASKSVTLTVGETPIGPLPALGLGIAAGAAPTAREHERLATLGLCHLRVDLRFGDDADWHAAWSTAAAQARALDVPLLVALFLPEGEATTDSLSAFLDVYRATPAPIDALLVFDAPGITTSAALATRARQVLGAALPDTPIGGGTDAFFTELNRIRPPVDALDFVSWSLNPTVHADDNDSMAETLAGQTATVTSARAFAHGLPLTVSPVTLRQRRNPAATGLQAPLPPGAPPPQMDTRQLSLFGAGWTAMTVKRLAEAGVSRVTLYETLGPCGVMLRDEPLPYADAFPAEPGAVFPLYHVLADLASVTGLDVLPVTSTAPRRADALAVRSPEGLRILIANLHDATERITLRLPALADAPVMRLLDATTAHAATHDPEGWHGRFPVSLPLAANGMSASLTLPAYAVACVDAVPQGREENTG